MYWIVKTAHERDGRKKGYIEVMKRLWDEMGCENLGIKAQNLRDQSARLKRLWILLQRSPEFQTTRGTFSRKQELQFLMMKIIKMIKSKEAKMLISRRMIA